MVKKIILYWLPVILWMIIIFFLSSRPRIITTENFLLDFVVYKTLHMIEYAILFFLLFRGLTTLNKLSFSKKLTFSFLLAVFYAVSDEIHQTFIPTRQGTIRDFFIDCFGIFFMYIYIKNHLNLIQRFLWKK